MNTESSCNVAAAQGMHGVGKRLRGIRDAQYACVFE